MNRRSCVTAVSLCLLAACDSEQGWNGSLGDLLDRHPQHFSTVMRDPSEHRLQIIYTQINRDADNRPTFRSFKYRVNSREYFYPASTVKLPTAIVALEKINRLGIEGLTRDTAMLTGIGDERQTPATEDATSPIGLPTVAHYLRKIMIVSDNDAFNRLYEFIGQDQLNMALQTKGLTGTRVVHRLEVSLSVAENRRTNPIGFVDGDVVVYSQGPGFATGNWLGKTPELLGEAEILGGERVLGPKNFAIKNALPLQELHDVLQELLFPGSTRPELRFNLNDEDYRLLYQSMSALPRESGISAYQDRVQFPDGYAKFLLVGGLSAHMPQHVRIFNKVGDAYGFLTDAAYIVDFSSKIEFLLAATVYTNANRTFNDNDYEYDEIGLPFLRDLGQVIYQLELARPREHEPDLSRLLPEKLSIPLEKRAHD